MIGDVRLKKVAFAIKYIFLGVMLLVTGICITTAIRIEVLNHLAGGAIQKKAEKEPHSKWRTGDGFFIAYKIAEEQLRREKGLSKEQDIDEDSISRIKILELVRASGWRTTPKDKLGNVLYTWGILQYPLSVLLLLISYFSLHFPSLRAGFPKTMWIGAGIIGGFCLLLAIWRGYFTSLGW